MAQKTNDIYACLDPRGRTAEKARTPLKTPRLAGLAGKNVMIVMRESFPNVMPAVQEELKNQVPEVKTVWWDFEEHGGLTVEQARGVKAEAAIVGVGY